MKLSRLKYYLPYLIHPSQTQQTLIKAVHVSEVFNDVWIEQHYLWLYQRIKPGTTLIDIGANIGDSAIYFAMNPNIKRIVAYEPFPKVYQQMLKNIEHPFLRSKITPINKALAEKRMSKKIDSVTSHSTIGADYITEKENDTGVRIESITLNDALEGLSNVAIKCDCEGAEKYLFDEANLDKVYAIEIEYHKNCEDKVIKILKKKGFKIKIERKGANIYALRDDFRVR